MATKNRTQDGVRQARSAANRAAKAREKVGRGAAPEADAVKDIKNSGDRIATADEVRKVGDRAAARWASLLKRLAE